MDALKEVSGWISSQAAATEEAENHNGSGGVRIEIERVDEAKRQFHFVVPKGAGTGPGTGGQPFSLIYPEDYPDATEDYLFVEAGPNNPASFRALLSDLSDKMFEMDPSEMSISRLLDRLVKALGKQAAGAGSAAKNASGGRGDAGSGRAAADMDVESDTMEPCEEGKRSGCNGVIDDRDDGDDDGDDGAKAGKGNDNNSDDDDRGIGDNDDDGGGGGGDSEGDIGDEGEEAGDEEDDDEDYEYQYEDDGEEGVGAGEEAPQQVQWLEEHYLKLRWESKEKELREKKQKEEEARLQEAAATRVGRSTASHKPPGYGSVGATKSGGGGAGSATGNASAIVNNRTVENIFSKEGSSQVLTSDLLTIMREREQLGIMVEPVDDNIHQWKVVINSFDGSSDLAVDLRELRNRYGYGYVELELSFTMDLYPLYPPLVKLIRPRFKGFMMARIASIDFLQLSNWNGMRGMTSVLTGIREALESWARLDVDNSLNDIVLYADGSYTPLEHMLMKLGLVTEVLPHVARKYRSSAPLSLSDEGHHDNSEGSGSSSGSNGSRRDEKKRKWSSETAGGGASVDDDSGGGGGGGGAALTEGVAKVKVVELSSSSSGSCGGDEAAKMLAEGGGGGGVVKGVIAVKAANSMIGSVAEIPPSPISATGGALTSSLPSSSSSSSSSSAVTPALAAAAAPAVPLTAIELSALAAKKKLEEAEAKAVELNDQVAKKKAELAKGKGGKKSNQFWAAGTGYGHGTASWDVDSYLKAQKEKDRLVEDMLERVAAYLKPPSGPLNAKGEGKTAGSDREEERRIATVLSGLQVLEESCLVPVLQRYLKSNSLLEMERHSSLYCTVMQLVASLAQWDHLVPLLMPLQGQDDCTSIYRLLGRMSQQAKIYLATTAKDKTAAAASSSSSSSASSTLGVPGLIPSTSSVLTSGISVVSRLEGSFSTAPHLSQQQPTAPVLEGMNGDSSSSSNSAAPSTPPRGFSELSAGEGGGVMVVEKKGLMETVLHVMETVNRVVDLSAVEDLERQVQMELNLHGGGGGEAVDEKALMWKVYEEVMRPLQYSELEKLAGYTYEKDAGAHAKTYKGGGERTRRLAQEHADLAQSLPLTLSSSVFVRAHEKYMDRMQIMISGPEDTPYSSGLFFFDAFFPSTYPNTPPKVISRTTGHATVRFNPNLYNTGKVCLSLLGTWEGKEGETWHPATSTFLQVLVSIQSLILVPQPFFNEPGFERHLGTPQGDKDDREYNARIREGTVQYAMIEQIQTPPKGWEQVVHNHFALKRESILKDVDTWVEEARVPPVDTRHLNQMVTLSHRLREVLNRMPSTHIIQPKMRSDGKAKGKGAKEAT